MNLQKNCAARASRMCLAPEVLEDRLVLSAGEGSTFAIMPGTVTTAGQVSTVNFKIDPTMFTAPKRNGDIVIGIDIAAATSTSSSSTTSTLKPQIVSVTDASGHVIRVQHSKYDPKVAKANKLGMLRPSAVSGDSQGSRHRTAGRELLGAGQGARSTDGPVPGRLLPSG